jgi:hypothetical protein
MNAYTIAGTAICLLGLLMLAPTLCRDALAWLRGAE